MKATSENIGQVFKVRLISYKSYRHYGGREIQTFAHIVNAELVALQDDYQRYIVKLIEPCNDSNGKLQYESGRKIAVCENDFAL